MFVTSLFLHITPVKIPLWAVAHGTHASIWPQGHEFSRQVGIDLQSVPLLSELVYVSSLWCRYSVTEVIEAEH